MKVVQDLRILREKERDSQREREQENDLSPGERLIVWKKTK